jgi:hypothetical protein
MSGRVRLNADVELEDKLAFGLTARQLVILGAAALAAYLAYTAASGVVSGPVAAAAATPFAIAGLVLALGRRDGVPGDRLALYAARHLLTPRRVLAPEGIPRPAPAGVGALDLPVRRVLRSGLVELEAGMFCLLLQASGAAFALLGEEEQAGLVDAFGRFLNGLTEPVQIAIRSEPLDLEARAQRLREVAERMPHPALAAAARDHARFLAGLAQGGEVRRREILLVLTTRAEDPQAASAALERRAGDAGELLGGAGVGLHRLDGEQAAGLLARAFDPPGPPAGATLEGTVHAC